MTLVCMCNVKLVHLILYNYLIYFSEAYTVCLFYYPVSTAKQILMKAIKSGDIVVYN